MKIYKVENCLPILVKMSLGVSVLFTALPLYGSPNPVGQRTYEDFKSYIQEMETLRTKTEEMVLGAEVSYPQKDTFWLFVEEKIHRFRLNPVSRKDGNKLRDGTMTTFQFQLPNGTKFPGRMSVARVSKCHILTVAHGFSPTVDPSDIGAAVDDSVYRATAHKIMAGQNYDPPVLSFYDEDRSRKVVEGGSIVAERFTEFLYRGTEAYDVVLIKIPGLKKFKGRPYKVLAEAPSPAANLSFRCVGKPHYRDAALVEFINRRLAEEQIPELTKEEKRKLMDHYLWEQKSVQVAPAFESGAYATGLSAGQGMSGGGCSLNKADGSATNILVGITSAVSYYGRKQDPNPDNYVPRKFLDDLSDPDSTRVLVTPVAVLTSELVKKGLISQGAKNWDELDESCD